MLEIIILFISREISRTTPTKINNDVVPKPLKLEIFKIPSIILGRVANIAKHIANSFATSVATIANDIVNDLANQIAISKKK